MDRERNYREDLKIDPDALDVEWVRQPELYLYYSELLAQAKHEVDKKKEELDIEKAEADSRLRNSYEKKPPEGQIANDVLQEEKVREAYKEYCDAKLNMDLMFAAVNAFNQRKEALENLVRLANAGYFASPSGGSRDLAEQIRKRSQQSVESVAEKRKSSTGSKRRTRRRAPK